MAIRSKLVRLLLSAFAAIIVAGCGGPIRAPSDYAGQVPLAIDVRTADPLCRFSMSEPGAASRPWVNGQYMFQSDFSTTVRVRPGNYVANVEGCWGAFHGELPLTIGGPTHIVITGPKGPVAPPTARPGYKEATFIVTIDMRAVSEHNRQVDRCNTYHVCAPELDNP